MSTYFNWLAHVHTLRAGGIAASSPRGLKATTLYVLRQPGGQQWWSRFRVAYDDGFQAYVDSLLSDSVA